VIADGTRRPGCAVSLSACVPRRISEVQGITSAVRGQEARSGRPCGRIATDIPVSRDVPASLQAKKAARVSGFVDVAWWCQADLRIRLATPIPSRPRPSRAMVPGSDTGVAMVALEKLIAELLNVQSPYVWS